MATYKVRSQGVEHTVSVVDKATGGSTVTIDGRSFDVELSGGEANPAVSTRPMATASAAMATAPVDDGAITAPIPGKIISIHVKVGDPVSANQVVLKLEAMKMENEIASPISGIVKEIAVREGSETSSDQLLMTIG
ncbi:MAG TPA: biotin/lipoyl-containing protein [Myxococcota bacterium]